MSKAMEQAVLAALAELSQPIGFDADGLDGDAVDAGPAVDTSGRDWCLAQLFSGIALPPAERLRLACEAGDPSLANQVRPLDPMNKMTQVFLAPLGESIAGGADVAGLAGCQTHPEIPLVLGLEDEPASGSHDGSGGDGSAGRRTRAEQSRINGAKSRGPKTDDGRIAACRNALRHGMRARLGLLPDEDPEQYRAFCDEISQEMSPTTRLQRELAQRIADLAWRLRRMTRVEARSLATDPQTGHDDIPMYPPEAVDRLRARISGNDNDRSGGELMRLQRYAGQLERSMRSALREYQQLQAIQIGAPAAGHLAGDARAGVPAGVVGTPPDVMAGDRGRGAPAAAPPATAAPPPTDDPPASPMAPLAGEAITDGLRFSGSFGAAATMAMPATAFTPIVSTTPGGAAAAATVVSGSLGQKHRRSARLAAATAPISADLLRPAEIGAPMAVGAI